MRSLDADDLSADLGAGGWRNSTSLTDNLFIGGNRNGDYPIFETEIDENGKKKYNLRGRIVRQGSKFYVCNGDDQVIEDFRRLTDAKIWVGNNTRRFEGGTAQALGYEKTVLVFVLIAAFVAALFMAIQ